jgi:hypothetical protein
MGLINLKTNLKSLKYGNDTLGGGDSGQPYIQSPIPEGFNNLGSREDFILRGGANTARDTATDVLRLGKMFADLKSPNGVNFIAKQRILSQTAVRTQTSGIENEGVYSPLNTLTQAGVIVTGGHLNKQGDPFAQTGAYSNNDNLYGVKVTPLQDPDKNRLVNLLTALSTNKQVISDNGVKYNPIIGNDGSTLIQYSGGPNSNLGVGLTNIRRAKISNNVSLTNNQNNYSYSQNTWVYNSSILNNPFDESSPTTLSPNVTIPNPDFRNNLSSPKIQDFRKILRQKLGLSTINGKIASESGATPFAPDYNTQNIENRVNLGNPGQRAGKNYIDYTDGVTDRITNKSVYKDINVPNLGSAPSGLDRITSLPIYRSENATTDNVKNDLVKFRIAVIDNDNPGFKTFIHFRAFLDSMSDSYTSTWNGFNYLGRGESFYTYGGFTRQMSLSWTVVAQSKQELIPMYKKLNYLASSLTPDYSPNGYMRGNLIQLTVGGYVYEQPGFITSLTYDIPTESPWEIGIGALGGEDPSVKELPHIIRVTGFSFTPIQRFIPKLQDNTYSFNNNTTGSTNDDFGFTKTYGPERYISLADGINKVNNNYDSN